MHLARLGKTYLGQGSGDGVAVGLTNGNMLGSGDAGKDSSDGGLGEHFCGGVYYVINA